MSLWYRLAIKAWLQGRGAHSTAGRRGRRRSRRVARFGGGVVHLHMDLLHFDSWGQNVVVQHLWGEVRLPVRQLLFGCVGVVAPSSGGGGGGGGNHGHGVGRADSTRSSGSGPGGETRERSRGRVGRRWLVNGAVSSLVVCLEGLGFDDLIAVTAHDQVKVVLCRTLPENGHIVSAQSHGFSVPPALFKTFFGFYAVGRVQLRGVRPAAPRLAQHDFRTRERRRALADGRHC